MKEKWSEISSEMFRTLISSYHEREEWTLNKVLEIQDPVAIYYGDFERRCYLLNEIPDFKEFFKYKQLYLNYYNTILIKKNGLDLETSPREEIVEFFNRTGFPIYLCILDTKINSPLLMPLYYRNMVGAYTAGSTFLINIGDPLVEPGRKERSEDVEGSDWCLTKWYTREKSGNLTVDLKKGGFLKHPDNKRMFRVRAIHYDDWSKRIHEYLDDGKDLRGCMEDIMWKKIKVKGID